MTMPASAVRVATPHASRYLAALCGRLARSAPAQVSEDEGVIDLPFGPCHVSALPGSLALVVEADDQERLQHLQWMVTGHLKRVAAKDPLDIEWTPVW